jgi:hypothetical protein
MTPGEHSQLCEVIKRAKAQARESRIPLAVIDHLYPEDDAERFQFAPVIGVNVLFNSEHFALIGIAWENGIWQTAGEYLEKHYRLSQ